MALTPGRIHIGMARIFVGVTPPTTGAPPTYVTHTNGVPASGTEVGLTDSEATFIYKATKTEIKAEQSLAPVDVYVAEEAASLKFTCKEQTYAALQQAFDNVGKESVAGGDAFYFGGGSGILTPGMTCVFLSSLQRTAAGKYLIVCLYKAYAPDGLSLPIGKAKESVYTVTLQGLADLTRTNGDQVGYYRWEK